MRSAATTTKTMPLRRVRMLVVAAVVGLLFGLLGIGEWAEDLLRTDRAMINRIPASGRVVLVTIDDKSQAALGRWPWSRTVQGDIITRLHRAGAKNVLMDVSYDYPTTESEDAAFEKALQTGPTVLPSFLAGGMFETNKVIKAPLPRFARFTEPSTVSAPPNWQMAVWDAYWAYRIGDQTLNYAPAVLVGKNGEPGTAFKIDYRYRLRSFPKISAVDVLRNPNLDLRGKLVVVGAVSASMGDQVMIPGRGRMGGVHVQAYATETLLAGTPLVLGFLPGLVLALGAIAAVLWTQRSTYWIAILGGAIVTLLCLPLFLDTQGVIIDIVPGIATLMTGGARLFWRRFRERGLTNAITGIPNFNALRQTGKTNEKALIVARLINYPQLSAALDDQAEALLVEQIVARLGVGAGDTAIYQGDEGLFAWLAEPGVAIGHHVEALHALFRSPARIAGNSYDLAISFGVEMGSARPLSSRLSSALVAADEAAAEGLKWKYHDPERLADSDWRLSLLAQLDQAIDNGEVWVAFQPQLDIASGQVLSAEALARWTHPIKGPISPHEFISAAETHGRIDRLTLFMLDKAIEAAAHINRGGRPFEIAVNLSARTLSRRNLAGEVGELLKQHGLDPRRLTLELTETSALAGDGSDLEPMLRLRDLGIKISIDDYGTGLSTLEYLKKVPACELKVDQSFIRGMRDNRSDLLMVRSTINLAHSLGRTVVAEGVEDERTLDALKQMECDRAQGYLIGRPMSFQSLSRRLSATRKGRAA